MRQDRKMKAAFTAVSGNGSWLKSLTSKGVSEVSDEKIMFVEKDFLKSLGRGRYVSGLNKFDLLMKVIDRSAGVKEDFADYLSNEILRHGEYSLKSFKEIMDEVNNAHNGYSSLIDATDIASDDDYYIHLKTLESAGQAVSNICDIINSDDCAQVKKNLIKSEILSQDKYVLNIIISGFGLSIGAGSFDVEKTLLKHSEEAGVDAFRIGTEVRIKKSALR